MARFFQLLTFHDGYLDAFYLQHPEVARMAYQDHLRALMEDGFGGGHLLAPYLADLGHAAGFTVVNSRPLQESWCRENGEPFPAWPEGEKELAARQVAAFAPDVLYLSESLGYDSRFLRTLPALPRLVLGWRAARISPDVDWTLFDAILSSGRHCLRIARERGARDAVYSFPGFAPFIADKVRGVPKIHDVVFCGPLTQEHGTCSALLTEIAKAPLGIRGDLRPAFFIHPLTPERIPAGVAMHDHGPRWGTDMYEALASARIVVNANIDIPGGEGPNMRLFEATGCGAFLLTERQHNIEVFFEPGVEVETFSSPSEMLDKIYYYLAHPEEREAIAARGHARCMKDYVQPRRALALDRLIRNELGSAEGVTDFGPDGARRAVDLLEQAEKLAAGGKPSEARELLGAAEALAGPGIFGLEHCRAVILDAEGDAEGSLWAARKEVLAHPENDRARCFFSQLMMSGAERTC